VAAVRRDVLDGLASGVLTPVIAKTFQFEQIVDAHRFLESNDQIGKVLLRSCSKANWPIGR
jgi:NADPH:quinone reductase-like Zn-dependent oxidoreductase